MKTEQSRKKVLIISPYFPYPLHDGGRKRIYNLIKHLSATIDIYLLSYVEKYHKIDDIAQLNKYCKKIYTVTRNNKNKIKNNKLPKIVLEFYTSDMVKILRQVLRDINPDIVQIEYIFMAQYANYLGNKVTVLTEHDMSWFDFKRSFYNRDLSEKNRFEEWCKIKSFAKEKLNKFAGIIVLSEKENRLLKKIFADCRSVVIPTGTDTEYYHPKNSRKMGRKTNRILFIAHFRHYPNLDALFYFIEDIFPKVLLGISNATFTVIGSGMKKDLLLLNKDRVRILGEVEDVRKHFYESDVFVAPIRLGFGVKGKILEAMSCGVPVIATQEAAEGIGCKHNRDILLAKNSQDFADKLVDLLIYNRKRSKLSSNARTMVERYYDWKKFAEKQGEFYKNIVSERFRIKSSREL